MMKKYDDAYAFCRVPGESRAGMLSATLVRMGMATALPQFMLGATLGHAMTFWQAMLATCLGSLILEFVSLGLGLAAMREGLSTSLLSRWCGFGRIGSALVGLIILISLVGWFGVQNSILANGILHALNFKINFFVAAFFSGFFLTVLVASGFRALSLTAKISVPLFFLVVGYILFMILLKDSSVEHNSEVTNISLSQGATIVAGGFIAAALTTPDISRYCKSNRDVFWMITLSIIVGEFIINAIAILIAQSLNTSDVVTIMTHGAGWIGLLSVILSVIKVNDVNLYSSSLGLANSMEVLSGRQFSYYKLTFILGSIGTLLSMLGILNHFVDFLVMLGVLFPPITGIMLVDYYILRTHRELLDFTRSHGTLPDAASTPKIGWNAILAWIVGSVVGFTINFGIPSLNSLFAASFFYCILCKFLQKRD